MAPDSNSEIGLPSGPSGSAMAGILLFGLIVRKLGLELVALADVDRVRAVGQAALLQHDVDLVAVGRGPGIDVDGGLGMRVHGTAGQHSVDGLQSA